jgi:hypothetical protein
LNIKYLPLVFTEHGAIMAANVLNSPRAVQISIANHGYCKSACLVQAATQKDRLSAARALGCVCPNGRILAEETSMSLTLEARPHTSLSPIVMNGETEFS